MTPEPKRNWPDLIWGIANWLDLIWGVAIVAVAFAVASFAWLAWAWNQPGCVEKNHYNFPACFNDGDD